MTTAATLPPRELADLTNAELLALFQLSICNRFEPISGKKLRPETIYRLSQTGILLIAPISTDEYYVRVRISPQGYEALAQYMRWQGARFWSADRGAEA